MAIVSITHPYKVINKNYDVKNYFAVMISDLIIDLIQYM